MYWLVKCLICLIGALDEDHAGEHLCVSHHICHLRLKLAKLACNESKVLSQQHLTNVLCHVNEGE